MENNDLTLYDVICIGGGPAGLSCAIRAAELGLNVLVLEARSKVAATAGNMPVDGYPPGFFSITRQELLAKMTKEAKYHTTIKFAEEVTKLQLHGRIKKVITRITKGDYFAEESTYKSKTVLFATGLRPSPLGIPGEKKFKGKGIYHYPPSIDPEGKKIIIVGHTSWAVRNALHYDSTGATVYLVTKKTKLNTHPALERKLNESFVNIMLEHEILLFQGSDRLSKVSIKDSDGKVLSLSADFVVILAGKSGNRNLYMDAGIAINPRGRIIVSANQETNIPGVFAAGSATREDSIVGVSAAEGVKAAEAIARYLKKQEQEEKETAVTTEIIRAKRPRFVEGKSVILKKEDLSPEIVEWVIKAPRIAKKALPGQFVILRVEEKGERIPLTIADSDKEEGTITLIFQKVGKTTKVMGTMEAGDHILNLLGPLGQPVKIEKWGTVVVLGGGCGVAPVLPKTKALMEVGNYVISIISARTSSLLICREDMRQVSHEFYIATDDGTEGHHGFGLDILKKMVKEGRKIDHVIAVGPIPMMRAVSNFTKKHNIPTIVSLAPLMVDGTGMCGACRVTVGGEVKFACVDGPNFDGHKVDFDELTQRSRAYLYEERISSEKMT